jgi:hypothetical protein
MRSLLYYAGLCEDRIKLAGSADEKAKWQGIIDVLIPICKGYVTERALELTSLGIQVYGGYGYIKDYPMEQLMRDVRITLIYEGTNGIQAMDLLGRKLGMNKGKPVMDLLGEMQQTVARAKKIESLAPAAAATEKAINRLAEVGMHMGATAMSPKVLEAFSFAHPFMMVTGDVVMAWMLLWRGVLAAEKLESGAKKKDAAFYEGQVKSVEFFAAQVLPVTMGKMDAILAMNPAVIEISEEAFGG